MTRFVSGEAEMEENPILKASLSMASDIPLYAQLTGIIKNTITSGTLRVGDTIVAGTTGGRVRAMMNAQGERVEEAGPSMPVEVLGFNDVPDAGDILYGTDDDKLGRQVVQERRDKIKADQLKARAKASLDLSLIHI